MFCPIKSYDFSDFCPNILFLIRDIQSSARQVFMLLFICSWSQSFEIHKFITGEIIESGDEVLWMGSSDMPCQNPLGFAAPLAFVAVKQSGVLNFKFKVESFKDRWVLLMYLPLYLFLSLLVRSCFLITLIKCLKGHKGLGCLSKGGWLTENILLGLGLFISLWQFCSEK